MQISLPRRHALMVEENKIKKDAFSHEINYATPCLDFLNLEEHPNCIAGSRVTMILLNGWILSIGGLPHLVSVQQQKFTTFVTGKFS